MSRAPNTDSLLTNDEGFNRTGTGVSTNIIVIVDDIKVGAIKSLNIREARSITQIDEVGTDGHVDSVPSKSTNITGSCSRTRFDGLRIAPAFERGFIHAGSQRIPFDIEIQDIFLSTDPNEALVTVIKNIWISEIAVTYRADDFVIVEDMNWEAEDIFSFFANAQGQPAATTFLDGMREIPIKTINPFEQSADSGNRRGALDGAGLLLAVDEAGVAVPAGTV